MPFHALSLSIGWWQNGQRIGEILRYRLFNADGSLKFPQSALQEERAALLSAARRIALLDWNSHCGLEVEESVEPLRLQSGGTKDMLAKRLTLESTRNRAIRVHLGEQLRVLRLYGMYAPSGAACRAYRAPGSMAGSAKQQSGIRSAS